MKKVWIAYNGIAVLILAALIVLDYVINIAIDVYPVNTIYTGLAIYLCGFNILIAMPIWLIVLLMNRSRMNRKSFLIGLVLFLMFLGMTAYPVMTAIGYTAF
ncbi:FtsH-binding integral membrane protein [Planomicrobium koreense]|uniref:FtsH-binding integral membrane protein n=1 Tax=Planococcus koreensis TaxID=112331 RepID=A0A7W8CUF3_9BACL|nr:hypothetical protein [Planococcus koreensis]MBB5180422.1 FtsH-binding integral membrane protein [Planococcus koreensis]